MVKQFIRIKKTLKVSKTFTSFDISVNAVVLRSLNYLFFFWERNIVKWILISLSFSIWRWSHCFEEIWIIAKLYPPPLKSESFKKVWKLLSIGFTVNSAGNVISQQHSKSQWTLNSNLFHSKNCFSQKEL